MGNNISTSIAGFISRLHAERDALKAFVTLLETEQQALLSGHTEQLLTLADSKNQAVHDLNRLASMRGKDFLALGIKTEAGGVVAWLKTRAEASLPVWHDIQRLAEQAQNLNSTSGKLIQTRLLHNQQALAILQNTAQNAKGLYGADGQAYLPKSSRTLGSG